MMCVHALHICCLAIDWGMTNLTSHSFTPQCAHTILEGVTRAHTCWLCMCMLSSHNLSPFTKAMSLSTSCLPASLFHSYQWMSQRHLTSPCLQSAPPSLSCWWTEDLTKLWNNSLMMNSGSYSAPPSSLSLKQNGRPTMANWWRLRWQTQKELNWLKRLADRGPPYLPLLCPYLPPILALPVLPENHPQLVPLCCTPP